MKITVENGEIFCIDCAVNPTFNERYFFDRCWGLFAGGGAKRKLNLSNLADIDYCRLNQVLSWARTSDIAVDESVLEICKTLKLKADEKNNRRRAAEEEIKKKVLWERLSKSGCGSCPNLKYHIDSPICAKTGDELEEKNQPKYIGNTLHLFNLVPFPSVNCPLNINKKQGEQQNDHL